MADLAVALVEDLRGPLLPIAAWARALREGDTRDASEARQALDWIERSAQAQQAKLDGVTEFAKAYRERDGPEETNLTEDIERAVRAAGGELSRVAIERQAHTGATRVSGRGSPARSSSCCSARSTERPGMTRCACGSVRKPTK